MIYNMVKECYFKSPYQIGTKKSKSWVICIPSEIVSEYKISASTGFILKHDKFGIKLQYVNGDEKGTPVDLVP